MFHNNMKQTLCFGSVYNCAIKGDIYAGVIKYVKYLSEILQANYQIKCKNDYTNGIEIEIL